MPPMFGQTKLSRHRRTRLWLLLGDKTGLEAIRRTKKNKRIPAVRWSIGKQNRNGRIHSGVNYAQLTYSLNSRIESA